VRSLAIGNAKPPTAFRIHLTIEGLKHLLMSLVIQKAIFVAKLLTTITMASTKERSLHSSLNNSAKI
jgi:hypothetical protein